MAATVSVSKRMNVRGGRMNLVSFTTNENYVTTGFAITANQCGLNNIDLIVCTPALTITPIALIPAYNGITGKIQYFWIDTTVDGAPLPEVPNATAIGLYSFGLVAYGN